MQHRRRFTQQQSLDHRLTDEAQRLRKEAQAASPGIERPGIERERLVRHARQAETASHMSEWLSSRGLEPPK
jgi:hypothetical protein